GNVLPIKTRPVLPDQVAALVHEVERQIGGRLKHTDLTELFQAHPAGVEICHAPVLKKNPGVGDVFGGRKDVDPDTLNPFHRRFHQLENDADVVYHQIKDNSNLRPARLKWREAISHDITGLIHRLLKKSHHRIEVLNVPHLHQTPVLLRGGKNLLGLVQIAAQGFFDQK